MLEKEIADRIDQLDGKVGLCLQFMDDDRVISHHSREIFPAASLIKLPIYYEYLCQLNERNLKSDQVVALAQRNMVGGCGILKDLGIGSRHTLSEIAEHMITVSDNIAANIMIDMLGMDRINESIRNLGLEQTVLQRKMMDFDALANKLDNNTSPYDMHVFFKTLMEPSGMHSEVRADLLGALKRQKLNHKLPALLPVDTVAAHKTGELDGVEHDAGIIYLGARYCTIVVMTMNLEQNAAGISFCRDIGRLVYRAMAQKSKVRI